MSAKRNGRFTVTEVSRTEHRVTYSTFLVRGWLNGRRIRKQFKDRAEAHDEKLALEIEAANLGGEIRPRNTRLSVSQLIEAEAAFTRLGTRPLSSAVEWLLSTFQPPVAE